MGSGDIRARFGRLASALICLAPFATSCALQARDEGPSDSAGSAGVAGAATAFGGSANGSSGAGVGGQSSTPCESDARCSSEGVLEVCRGGEWIKSDACRGPEYCSATRRTCLSCAPGTFACAAGGKLEQCAVDGATWEVVRECGAARDCFAEGDVGYCVVCAPGATLCEDASLASLSASALDTQRAALRRCNELGSGTSLLATCSRESALCSAERESCLACEPNESVCSGRMLSKCNADGSALMPVAECASAAACDAVKGVCVATGCKTQAGKSVPVGSVICEKTTLSICRAGEIWEVLDICASEAACTASVAARECLDASATRCTPNTSACSGNVLRRCAAASTQAVAALPEGSWYDYAECAVGCRATSSDSAECVVPTSGATYVETTLCEPGASTYSVCSSSGCVASSCDVGTVCAGSALGCTSCVPAGLRCAGDLLMRCDDSGERESVQADCSGQYCDPVRGRCLPARVGERYCDDSGRLLSVNADGSTRLVQDCGRSALCDAGGCLVPSCTPGAVTCGGDDGNLVLSCVDGLAWRDAGVTCPSERRCLDGLGCALPVRVTAGDAHTCALFVSADAQPDASGYLYCWGANDAGQLGNGSTLPGDEPEARPVLTSLGRDGKAPAALPMFRRTGLCAGNGFTCADIDLPSGGVGVACFGSNERGQLGQTISKSSTQSASARVLGAAVQKPSDAGMGVFTGLHGVTCGTDFACALSQDSRGYCWGANDVGQLGSGVDGSGLGVVPVASLSKLNAIVAGARHACAIDVHGQVYCWGDNAKGGLGQGLSPAELAKSLTPLRLTGLLAEFIGAGQNFAFSLDQAGNSLLSWGQNQFGQLGNSTATPSGLSLPLAANRLDAERVDRIITGPLALHACALSAGSLSCWGANALGEIGDASRVDRPAPALVIDASTPLVVDAGAVALGKAHSCAISASGALLCWGANQRGQLGARATAAVETAPFVAY